MKRRISIGQGTFLAVVVSTLIAIFVKGQGPTGLIIALLSVATFLFGIIGAQIMQNRHKRLDGLRVTLRKDDGIYLNIYKMSSIFSKKVQKQTQKLIDNYYVKTIDYFIVDFYKANKEFIKLFDYLKNLKIKTPKQEEVYGRILDSINEADKDRKHIEYLVRNKMLKFKWYMLIGLLVVILLSVFTINDNSTTSVFISILLATFGVIFLLIIRELDSLMWKEQKWIWDPLEQLFNELDLLPYYPAEVILNGRVKVKKGVRRRIAYYPKLYLDFTGKKVKVES
ncbi:MAG: hypothetical protein KJ718_05410 [Nanoarchaeota archaeon]|nr:hypothetical protein [Nanoarchaeota archaeon]MBU1051960.1 hypothetical protein [Nanoarchaeota archaeon]MBU1988300.1 hypothetical protein [Nanoarchaeota archaeon]